MYYSHYGWTTWADHPAYDDDVVKLARSVYKRRGKDNQIYVIHVCPNDWCVDRSTRHGIFKVGVSCNPLQRMKTLRWQAVSDPRLIPPLVVSQRYNRLAWSVPFFQPQPDDAYRAERTAHELLAPLRIQGEWFECSANEATFAVRQACLLNEQEPDLFAPGWNLWMGLSVGTRRLWNSALTEPDPFAEPTATDALTS